MSFNSSHYEDREDRKEQAMTTHTINKKAEQHLQVLSAVSEMIRDVVYEGCFAAFYVMDNWQELDNQEDSIKLLLSACDVDSLKSLRSNYRVYKPVVKPKPSYQILNVTTGFVIRLSAPDITAARKVASEGCAVNKDDSLGYLVLTVLEGKIIAVETFTNNK